MDRRDEHSTDVVPLGDGCRQRSVVHRDIFAFGEHALVGPGRATAPGPCDLLLRRRIVGKDCPTLASGAATEQNCCQPTAARRLTPEP